MTSLVCSAAFAACPAGDIDHNCVVDFHDLRLFAQKWLDSPGGSANLDGIPGVHMVDYALFAANWQKIGLPLLINEFMASNNTAHQDPNGDFDDWIEIYNAGNAAIDIGGMFLTDDLSEPNKWQIPNDVPLTTTIEPNGFLVFWADNETNEGLLHTNFKLEKDGEQIGLFDIDAVTLIDSLTFTEQVADISYGRFPDANATLRFFGTPTPGTANSGAFIGIVDDTKFSRDRGFYDTPFNVGITCKTQGVTIRYTLDGNEPTETSTEYTAPLAVSTNTCLRATAFKPGWMPTNVDTQTYIFDACDAIKSLPVISIVGDEQESLYEPNGIMAIVGGNYGGSGAWQPTGPSSYNNPIQRGMLFERPVSAELIESPNNTGFQIDCGIRVAGSDYHRPRYTRGDDWFNNYDKFSFKLFFRGSYGDAELEYPLFPEFDVDRFKAVTLRGGHNDVINPFIKDEFFRRIHKNMGGVASSGTFANLYINGDYKAYYNPCERLDHDFFRTWYDSDKDWDVITQRAVRNGDDIAFDALIDYALINDLSNDVNYQYVAARFDTEAFIDYLLVQLYAANWDWPTNNWTAAAERSPEGIFRFYIWDIEGSMDSWININLVGFNSFPNWAAGGGSGLNGENGPIPWMYQALKVNPDFMQLFTDHIWKHFFNNGPLTDAYLLMRFNELRDIMSGVLPSMDTYVTDTFIPQRRPIMFTAFKGEGLFPRQGPSFYINGAPQYGGYADSLDSLTITDPNASGTIYYTLDGPDPRQHGGTLSPAADTYTSAITLTKTTLVRARVFDSNGFSPLSEAAFTLGTVVENLRVTEIMYHPQDTNDPNDPNTEYIELTNIGPNTLNLNLVSFTEGIHLTFGDVNLAPDEYIVAVKDVNAFTAQYGAGPNVAGQYSGSLSNAGEPIQLLDALGDVILDFKYRDGWRGITDGDGYSLTIIDPNNPDVNTWDTKDAWRASVFVDGSPGADDSGILPNPGDVVINELLAHSDTILYDWIELHNTTAQPIDIGGWFLSDSGSDRTRYEIAAATTIDANGYIVFYEDTNFGVASSDPGRHTPFALSENGETLYLASAQDVNGNLTGYRRSEDFGASEPDVAFGRYYKASTDNFNFVAVSANTAGSANAYPKVGPITISEIMYNPVSGNQSEEYVELHNITASTVFLYDYNESEPWIFSDGIEFAFPIDTNIPASGLLMVAKDPNAFTAQYGSMPPGVQVLGPYDGYLNDGGEKLEISMPGDVNGLGRRQYIRIDRVNYDDDDPWPTTTDGWGKSLTKKDPNDYANDFIAWDANNPTPGTK